VLWVNLIEFHVCTVLIDCGQLGQSVADSSHNCFEADNFGMNTGYGRYGAAYNMVGLICFNDELPCV
jgi:hypothetical protein